MFKLTLVLGGLLFYFGFLSASSHTNYKYVLLEIKFKIFIKVNVISLVITKLEVNGYLFFFVVVVFNDLYF